MSDLVCPGCGYTFKTKRSLTKHFNRKYSCTPGCAFPDTHVAFNKTCKCKTCDKAFSHSSGLYRHKKDCQGAHKPGTQKNNPVTPNTTGVVNVSFQGNNNNVHVPVNVDNRQYVINIVPYDPNTPPQVSHEKFVNLMKGGGAEHTVLKLVEDGHFDPEKPETMNVYISNLPTTVTNVTNSNNAKDDTSFVTKQDTNFGLVYLIQPEELLGTNRYKLGCSSKPNLDRLKSYKKNSHLLCSYKCTDPFQTENRLKAVFASKFTKVAGNEYFQGNENEMVKEFLRTVYLNT
jgi:hypothetical protein